MATTRRKLIVTTASAASAVAIPRLGHAYNLTSGGTEERRYGISGRTNEKTAHKRNNPATLFVALLRGINVSGRNMIPMAELRSVCEELKWRRVQSYIQSGNLIFAADGAPAEIESRLEQAITRHFGHSVPAIVRAASDWPSYIRSNPLTEACKNGAKSVMLILSKHPPKSDAAQALQERAMNGERVFMAGNALWIHFTAGVAGSKLSPALLDRLIGSTATARNWNTVLKINELIEGARRQIEQPLVSSQDKAA